MCVLRAMGSSFKVQEFLRSSTLKPCDVYTRGQPRLPKSRPQGDVLAFSGLTVPVSDASWSDLDAQVADAERFLDKHAAELRRLVKFRGVEDVVLDFPIDSRIGRGVVAQFDRLPASLVRATGRLGLAIELSVYAVGPTARSNKRLQRAAMNGRAKPKRRAAAAEPPSR